MNALIVDDEEEICLLLANVLKKNGIETQYALNLKEAKEKIGSNQYNYVFLDLKLPDGVGYDLVPDILYDGNNTKLIVCSAYDSEEKKAYQEGAHYFLSKPLNVKKVELALDKTS